MNNYPWPTRMHPTLKKTLKWSALMLGGVIVGVPLLLAAINLVDQDVKSEAVAFANFTDDEVPDQENGYFSWVGLAAPAGEKPHVVGMATVSSINQKTVQGTMVNPTSLLGENALRFKGDVSGLCGRDSRGCLVRYRVKAAEIRKWLSENHVLIERYRELYAYPQFRETIQPRLRAPIFYEPSRVASLIRAQHALMALSGDPQTALRGLRDDTKYWKLVLQQSRSLISRMMAVAAIHGNTQLVSEIVATMPLHRQALILASEASQPLSEDERNLGKIFRNELGLSIDVFTNISHYKDDPCSVDSWSDCLSGKLMSTFLLKPNASINLSYMRLARMARMASLPAQEWYLQVQARHEDGSRENTIFVWHILYNPMGKVLDGIAEAPYEGYSGRVHNLDGFLRLVSLQIAAKESGTREPDMDKYLAASMSTQRNPYTGDAMQWDASSRTIYFYGYHEIPEEKLLSKRIEAQL